MPEPIARTARYMAGLDGLRAVAVLAVIAYHLNTGWAPGGLLGVSVFFVLSGYLITDLLLGQRARDGPMELREFWLRRARRLLPALWVMLAVVIVWVTVAEASQLDSLRQDVLAALFYVSNWSYIVQHISYFASFGPPSPLGHLWSLAVEEQFYLVWPLLLFIAVRYVRDRRLLVGLVLLVAVLSACAMALVYQPGIDPSRAYYGTDTRAFELLTGAALAVLWPSRMLVHRLPRMGRRALDAGGGLGLLVIALMVGRTDQYQPFLYRGGMVLIAIATAVVIAALAHPTTRLSAWMAVRPLRWVGVRSYGIYLWHFPVIVLTTPLNDTAGAHVVRGILQVAATFAIAALSWKYIEQPIRREGFSVVVRWVRSVRWPLVGLPAGLWDGLSASALIVGVAATGITGVVPVAAALEPAAFSSLAVSTTPFAGVNATCARPAPKPAPSTLLFHTSSAAPPAPHPVDATAIGDSIMIDLSPYLSEFLPGVVVDGEVSRQAYQLPDVIASLRAQNQLHRRLILELGTNGPVDGDQLLSTLRSLGPMERIVLVNTQVPRPWQSDVNQTITQVATELPHTTVVDWNTASAGRPDYFYADGVHPNPDGAQVMASLIAQAVTSQPVSLNQSTSTLRCASL